MPKERVDVLAYKQGLFETREQAKRGVMAGLVVSVLNGERFDKPGEKIDEATELKLKGEKLKYVSRGGLKLEKALQVFGYLSGGLDHHRHRGLNRRFYGCHAAKWCSLGLRC